MAARDHETPTFGHLGGDSAPHGPLRRGDGASTQRPAAKSPRGSTSGGITPRATRLAALVAVAGITAACSTYSEGAMGEREAMPHTHGPMADAAHPAGAHAHPSSGDGLSATLNGYTLDDLALTSSSGGSRLSFRILGPSGAPQLQFSLDQGKLLHLYVVSEDLSSFHHAHPVLDSTGEWTVDLPGLGPGVHHVVTSFVAIAPDSSEQGLTLGSDVLVEGTARSKPLPPETPTETVDGYQVRLTGDLLLAQPSRMRVEITRRGRQADLVPYLDNWLHLSAVSESSRSFLHLHPDGPAAAGSAVPPVVTLTGTPPAPGRYRLFVEFATGSGLHRVAFTRTAWG